MWISVTIAFLNGSKVIDKCIKSILSQSCKDIEHIIIDSGSTDGTLDVIKAYKDYISKVVNEPDEGIYDALNKGIKLP